MKAPIVEFFGLFKVCNGRYMEVYLINLKLITPFATLHTNVK